MKERIVLRVGSPFMSIKQVFPPDTFVVKPVGTGFLAWLQVKVIQWLKHIGAMDQYMVERDIISTTTIEVDIKDVIYQLKHVEDQILRCYNTGIKCIVMGSKQFYEAQQAVSVLAPGLVWKNPNGECKIADIEVVLVPWFDGCVVVPETNSPRVERSPFPRDLFNPSMFDPRE